MKITKEEALAKLELIGFRECTFDEWLCSAVRLDWDTDVDYGETILAIPVPAKPRRFETVVEFSSVGHLGMFVGELIRDQFQNSGFEAFENAKFRLVGEEVLD
jgi:hypothetical protein